MESKTINLLALIGVLVVLGIMIYVVVQLKSEGVQCQLNPLVYGAKKFGEANNADFVGSGFFMKPNSPLISFNAHNLSVTLQNNVNPMFSGSSSFNFSNLDMKGGDLDGE